MSKKKSILDMLEEEIVEEVVEEVIVPDTAVVMDPANTKRQTYCMTHLNIEMIRHVAFEHHVNKQDVVNIAVYNYIRDNYPDIYKKVMQK